MIPVRVEGSKLIVSFHPGQAKAWQSQARYVFMFAGTQGGKTSFGPYWLWREIKRRGAGDYLAVTSNFDLFNLKMLPALIDLFVTKLGWGRWVAGQRVIELSNPKTGEFSMRGTNQAWARIILRSAVSGSGLEASTANAAWLDECGQDEFSLGTWEAVQRRLSLAQGRVLGTTTLYNMGWTKTHIYDEWKKGDPQIEVIQFASVINPAFSKEEFERVAGKMQRHRFMMFYLGEYAMPPGLIYSQFDTLRHKIKPFRIPNEWPRYVGLDFGAANTALVWLAKDPATNRVYLYDESVMGGKTTKEHVNDFLTKLGHARLARVVGGAPSESQQRRDWTAAGVTVTQPSVVDVEAGIDRVADLIQNNRLYVFETCEAVLDELGTYKRVVDEEGNVYDEIDHKRIYHLLDALRYAASILALPILTPKVLRT